MEEGHKEKQQLVSDGAPQQGHPSLDLQLCINVSPSSSCVEALQWQTKEHMRLAAMEKAYAERVRELTRREMELAQSEFTRARSLWMRATEEFQRAHKLKERATNEDITCHSCSQRFKPT